MNISTLQMEARQTLTYKFYQENLLNSANTGRVADE